MSFLINPFTFAVAGGDFESIATVTVGSGGASSVTFSDIPSTYQHLQVRAITRFDTPDTGTYNMRFNGTGEASTDYRSHRLTGTGASVAAAAWAQGKHIYLGTFGAGASSIFGATIIDVLDYASTSKYKTVRCFSGCDVNGSGGLVQLQSGLYMSTSAVTSILLNEPSVSWQQHSTFALFGVKAP